MLTRPPPASAQERRYGDMAAPTPSAKAALRRARPRRNVLVGCAETNGFGEGTMKLPRRKFLHHSAAAVAAALSRTANAESYPSRPVHIIVGFAPGGGTDIMARLIGSWLSNRLGQAGRRRESAGRQHQYRDRGGRRAPADGYTLLLACLPNAINAALYPIISSSISSATSRPLPALRATPFSSR